MWFKYNCQYGPLIYVTVLIILYNSTVAHRREEFNKLGSSLLCIFEMT